MSEAFKLTINQQGIATILFDVPNEKINKISLKTLLELDRILDQIKNNKEIKAVLLKSGKPGIFIAGADLNMFENLFKDFSLAEKVVEEGHRVFRKLETLPFPSIAVINGACLGGGLELSLACTYRIVADHPKTSLGLPETTLGIFPGWGGTQRLPRLVGLMQGLLMILSGSPVDAKKAFKIKLADAIAPAEFLDEKVDEFLKECLTKEGSRRILKERKQKTWFTWLLEDNYFGRSLLYWQSRKNVIQKTRGFYPAPLAALRVIKKTHGLPLEKGLKKEREMFSKCMKNDFRYAPYLIQLFFNSEEIKKDPGQHQANVVAKPIRSVGVLGAGTMGNGIAWLMSYRDIPVRMKDVNLEAVGKGLAAAWDTYKTLIRIRKIFPGEANRKFHLLAGTVDYTGFKHLDLIIEAATENLELKHKILRELEQVVRPDAIIATNTSSLTIGELATVMKHPERLVGMHFFNPPSRMPLVEIVAGEQTAPEVVAAAVDLCKSLKKTPIVVGDCSGFLVNRVFARGFLEAMRMLEEGVDMGRLDALLLKFGMPMAPFVLADEVGNDVNLKATRSFEKAYGKRFHVPQILEAVNEHKLYGKKVGKGFYIYGKKKKDPNPEIKELIQKHSAKVNLSDQEVVDRITLSMVNEASRCLEEGIVDKPGNLDIAMVFGIGFPPFRGGLLSYANTIGIDQVVKKMKAMEDRGGDRFTPTQQLLDMASSGKKFDV